MLPKLRRPMTALLFILAASYTPALAGGGKKPEPISIKKYGNFFVSGTHNAADRKVGQMYVEYQIPAELKHPYPIIFIHGGGQIGAAWTTTSDGREGWAPYFLRRGYAVYIVDQAARGRSPYDSDLGPVANALDSLTARQRFTQIEQFNLWPAAKFHTQWPGNSVDGDPTFEQFLSSQSDSISTAPLQEELTADGIVALLDKIGPSILIPHSQPGSAAWLVLDKRPKLVKALVTIEPGGPPVYRDAPFSVGPTFSWGLTRNPITYSPPVSDPTQLTFVRVPINDDPYVTSVFLQDTSKVVHTLPNLAKVPILLLSSPSGYNTLWDPGTDKFLTQAGVPHEWLKLQNIGIRGNGHFSFIEKNSDQVASVVQGWIEKTVKKPYSGW